MKLHLKLLMVVLLSGFAARAAAIPDTLEIPKKILDLPKVVATEGDRAGVWGLPTLVALRYGLTIEGTRDDRFDEEASMRAALHYLYDLHKEFGDWDLCYYAYLYSPAYVRNLQKRNLSIPQPKPVVRKPAPPKIDERPNEPKYIVYVVKSGDTLSKIAKNYHVKVSDIKKWNNLKSDFIRDKQKLKIYK